MPRLIVALVVSLHLLATTYASGAQDDFDLVAYQEAMLNAMDRQGIAGVVIVAVEGDEVIYLASFPNPAR